MISFLAKFILKSINLILNKLNFKVFVHRINKVHKPVIYDQFLWETYYENFDEMKLYNVAMRASFSSKFDNPYKQLRFYSLQNILKNILNNKVNGDIVECGVWKGHSAFIISKILEKTNSNKIFYIFDSFEGGLSDKSLEDKNKRYNLSNKQIKYEKLSFASDEDQVKSTLSIFKNIYFFKGWIPERFNEVNEKSFCFVHIDVDLFQPTLDSLNYFYPRLNQGGAIVIDDYGISQFPGARKAVDKFLKSNKYSFFYKVPFGSCFIIK
tara:strand:- start:664 stop:1464 length:801 start_codon:yes stop_codon:yes gene_type:complete